MTDLHLRSFDEAQLTVRDNGRELEGLCVPFNVEQDIPAEGIREVFRSGAFAHQCRAPWRLGLYDEHQQDTDHRLGLCRQLEERSEGLWASFKLLPSRAQLVAEMVAEGHSGLSVGFVDKWPRQLPNGLVERRRVHLAHVALVGQGAYPGAEVLALRDDEVEEAHPDTQFWADFDKWALQRKRQSA